MARQILRDEQALFNDVLNALQADEVLPIEREQVARDETKEVPLTEFTVRFKKLIEYYGNN